MDEFNIVDWDGKDGVEFELEKGIVDKDGHLHKSGIIRYTRVRDRDASIAIASRNGARATTILLHHLVEFDDGYKPSEREITLMSTRDRNLLGNLLNDNAFGVDMSIDVECPNCGNIFKGVVANFTL